MKYFKAGIAAAVLLMFGVISFRVARAQGPGTDSSETIARPKKKNLPPPDPAPVEDSTDPAPAPKVAPSNPPAAPADSATDEPKIPSKFNRKDKELPADTPTFSSDVNTVQLDAAVLDNKGKFLPNIP